MNINGNIPVLGQPKPRVGAQVQSLVRHLDLDGTFEAAGIVNGPTGPVAAVQRSDYLDAEQLLDAIRQIVRDELHTFYHEERGEKSHSHEEDR